MSKKRNKNLIAGLDIGTSKVVAIIAEVTPEGKIDIMGVGIRPSTGLKKGVVVNIDATASALQGAIEDAEVMAGTALPSVVTGIAGSHIRSFDSHGIAPIHQEVTAQDVERVMDAAKAVAIPLDQKILHVLAQEFIIDGQEGIREPIGMAGVRLEAKVHMVTGSVAAAQNIVKCIRRCELEVEDIILEQLASSYAVLTEDEKQLGVCMIDIGGGTTDIAIFTEGAIRYTAVIPVAGDQVTNDIAVALRVPTQSAESIKIQYACALAKLTHVDEMLEVLSTGDRTSRQLSRVTLAEIVEPRYEELFSLVQAELRRSGLERSLGAGIVLTGGSARMEGVIELAEEIFQMPVRLGVPRDIAGLVDVVLNPIYSTAVGLLQYGYQHRKHPQRDMSHPGVRNFVGRVKNWFQGNF